MKQLSIVEKAKRYDEAIKKAEKWHNAPNVDKIPTFGNRIIEDIFPELYESEDERIKNEIIDYISTADDKVLIPYESWIAWLEKQGRQKSTDKVEPKFKVGDWVAINPELRFASPLYIKDIDKSNYRVESLDGNSGAPTIDYLDNHYHLWTIKDAKEGDVLVWNGSKCITLFKNIYDEESFRSHGLVGHCTGIFEPRQGCHDIEGAHPATKEQRDTLERAMTNAGYRWNKEELKLEKI